MIILDKPYVSDFIQSTIAEMKLPVLKNDNLRELVSNDKLNIADEKEFLRIAKTREPLLVYCNSENSINWISQNLQGTGIPDQIDLMKNKVRFRNLIKGLYPNFFFQEVNYEDLGKIDVDKIKKPFIIKPAVGFFSIGVYKVSGDDQWAGIVSLIQEEMEKVKDLFPAEVMDASKFIIEENINGEEFAIDAYFNGDGKPVILNIFKHPFSSEQDVSDRLYYTSGSIIKKHFKEAINILSAIGDFGRLKNFPVHMELRIDENGQAVPIEVNPMRFAGWCTTDIAFYAYGINVYEYYFYQKEPDWEEILAEGEDDIFSLVIADIPKDIDLNRINEVDYKGFASGFSHLLELRKINYKEYPVFAFAFIKTAGNSREIDKILKKDLRPYIRTA